MRPSAHAFQADAVRRDLRRWLQALGSRADDQLGRAAVSAGDRRDRPPDRSRPRPDVVALGQGLHHRVSQHRAAPRGGEEGVRSGSPRRGEVAGVRPRRRRHHDRARRPAEGQDGRVSREDREPGPGDGGGPRRRSVRDHGGRQAVRLRRAFAERRARARLAQGAGRGSSGVEDRGRGRDWRGARVVERGRSDPADRAPLPEPRSDRGGHRGARRSAGAAREGGLAEAGGRHRRCRAREGDHRLSREGGGRHRPHRAQGHHPLRGLHRDRSADRQAARRRPVHVRGRAAGPRSSREPRREPDRVLGARPRGRLVPHDEPRGDGTRSARADAGRVRQGPRAAAEGVRRELHGRRLVAAGDQQRTKFDETVKAALATP